MNPLEWARRRAGTTHPERVVDLLRETDPATAVARSGLNAAWVDGVRTFYDLLHDGPRRLACTGTACAFASAHGSAPASTQDAREVACLGRCYAAPAADDGDAGSARSAGSAAPPIPRRALVGEPVVLRHLLGASRPLDDYELQDGAAILERVTASGLAGRGGAAFPTGAKWRIARDTPAPERVVVANGDEGDPGAYVDRLLLEEAPHSVLAGMLACARAIGAGRGVVYVRGEYPAAAARVQDAIDAAKAAGKLAGFHVEVVRGAGSYVAGEETALLRSIEGLRAEPSPKPPYPAERGLFGLPTVVQNVETLSVVPWVVARRRRPDTKAICLSGAIARPGVVEVALGTPLRRVLEDGGAGGGGPPPGRRWRMALVGGPMGRLLTEREFDVPLSWTALPGLGHGGVVVFDETVSPRALAEHLFRFAARESCGACTPCRAGTRQLSGVRDRAAFDRLLDTLEQGSLCGFGQGVPRPLRDLLRSFPGEVVA